MRTSIRQTEDLTSLRAKSQVQIGEHVGCRGVASWKWRETWLLNQALLKRHEPALFERYRERRGTRFFHLE